MPPASDPGPGQCVQRWAEGNTPWHLDTVNPWLAAHWPALQVPAGAQVRALFEPRGFAVRELAEGPEEPAPPHMQEQGLSALRERVYHLRRE